MLAIRTLIHPTDFSWQSEAAFRMACALACDYRARLIVIHVQTPPSAVFGEIGTVLPESSELARELYARLTAVQPAELTIRVEHRLSQGDPAAEILRLAQETHCDLIVMGTHGRTGLARLLVGSVAEEVLRRASCPVLTLRSPFPETVPATGQAIEEPVPV
jgi:nucleotide-binding universal stress UspA family protein